MSDGIGEILFGLGIEVIGSLLLLAGMLFCACLIAAMIVTGGYHLLRRLVRLRWEPQVRDNHASKSPAP
ncbi:hypothetical protein Aple_096460 [Acrocarpospora pleiomorpha]|uniref:Uncharacterized protein n=1 Tax=Acrocarpospora pleiomorpha TaxID=90975 RepID=A0A5M3Y080_9ACTN|nr:hypothetical protein [Acrocarpospora pleiomorpha]GES26747.1 hypothetical protein Aple_096460 [Acrocarpospora pleiomorpha]